MAAPLHDSHGDVKHHRNADKDQFSGRGAVLSSVESDPWGIQGGLPSRKDFAMTGRWMTSMWGWTNG